ncbi:uncharacterized protein LOC110465574 [Mizuhopecten yessoensis]|uniref:Toxin CaTX-A n=1 Tax=Mizuhopecten yessoensis TaxID=6573 RepID=A0A210R1Z6_MIZYE|nr:uncharacterized protein LOC110465574 [Mizuhopecten yessoensis]OWF54982.1 Toxin CaTX-A [Mizuhopecten yessoensis]
MPSVGDVVDILSKIGEYLQRINVHIKDKIEIAITNFRNVNGSVNIQKLEEIYSFLTKLYGYLPQFTSGDPVQLLKGLVGIVATVSAFTGWGGPVVPVICGVLTVIFSSFGGKVITIGEVVESQIRRTFCGHSYETLLQEAQDLHLKYQLAYDFLNPKSDKREFSEHDITNMNIQMNVFQGATFLRKLGDLIKELAKEHKENDSNKKSEKANKAMQFIELYIKLASLRDMILWHFFTITNSTSHSQHLAGCVQRVICSFDERDREALGMFLKPTEEYVYIVSYVREEIYELFMKFLEQKKLLPDQSRLTHGQFGLYSAKWPHWHAIRRRTHASTFQIGDLRFLCGSKSASRPESLFCFKRIRGSKNYFHIIQRERYGELVCMTKGSDRWVMSLKGAPTAPECTWKVIQMENGNYVFAPLAFPDYFMGMTKLLDGSIGGFLGGYDEQCHWILID